MQKQLATALEKGINWVVIIGEDELKQNIVYMNVLYMLLTLGEGQEP